MTNKDFLSQFSNENKKPDSFKEEERIKITKDRKPINTKTIFIFIAVIVVVVGVVLFILLRPTIEVKNFVGLDSSEAKAWIKQNEIETQGIIFKEEYNFEYDEGIIVSQSANEGEMVGKKVKMDFVVSMGADPEELIAVPDIENMMKQEIQDWIKDNKLQKTKITTSYNDDTPIDEVVSFEFKGVESDSFTRSSVLNIVISKGPQPAGVVTVEDFVKQDFSIVESWGKKNNIEIIKATKYDDKILKDVVISQSIDPKKTIKAGDSLTVVVSLGKGIVIPNFASMSKTDIDDWVKENETYIKVKEKYSNSDDYVIEQSLSTGKYFGEDNKLYITKNLGNNFYIDEISFTFENNSYDKFKDFANELIDKGLYIDTHKNFVKSEKPARTILSIYDIYDDKGIHYSTAQRLPLDVHIVLSISDGSLANKVRIPYEDYIGQPLSGLRSWIDLNPNYQFTISTSLADADNITSIKFNNGTGNVDISSVGGYLAYGTELIVN